jgi:hypothetical protein
MGLDGSREVFARDGDDGIMKMVGTEKLTMEE